MATYTSKPRDVIFMGKANVPDRFVVTYKKLGSGESTIHFYGTAQDGTKADLMSGGTADTLAGEQGHYDAQIVKVVLSDVVSFWYVLTGAENVQVSDIQLVTKQQIPITANLNT